MILTSFQTALVTGIASGVLTGCLLAIAWIDSRSLRIPDVISLPLIGVGLLVAAVLPGGAIADHVIGAVAGFAVLALIGEVFYRRTGTEGLGLGDAKLFAGAGAWLGWQALPMVLLIAAMGGLMFALWRRRQRGADGPLAFGPWLSLGFWVIWVAQCLTRAG